MALPALLALPSSKPVLLDHLLFFSRSSALVTRQEHCEDAAHVNLAGCDIRAWDPARTNPAAPSPTLPTRFPFSIAKPQNLATKVACRLCACARARSSRTAPQVEILAAERAPVFQFPGMTLHCRTTEITRPHRKIAWTRESICEP